MDVLVEVQGQKDKVTQMMFERIELNSETLLVEITKLTIAVNSLKEEVNKLKHEVQEHKERLQSLRDAVTWTDKYAVKFIAFVAFIAVAWEGVRKLIPHL